MPYAPILIDQSCDDKNDLFLNACTNASFPIQFREQIGYDNNYFFLQTFLEDHFKYHKKEFDYSD
jgi:S-formylglutathione hydrolase